MNKIRYSIDRIKLSFYTAMSLLDQKDEETEQAISNIENAFKALKRLEQIDMILADFKLTNLQNLIDTLNNIEFLERQNTTNLKKLKALEIIKEKGISKLALKLSNNVEQYNSVRNAWSCNFCVFVKELTKEEFNIMKEVML